MFAIPSHSKVDSPHLLSQQRAWSQISSGNTPGPLIDFSLFRQPLNDLNRPFSYSENESGSNDISLDLVEFSNVHNCNQNSNHILKML